MPEQGGQLEWAKVNAGIKEHGDISPDKLDKVDALKLLHQFVLHAPDKPIDEGIMTGYWKKIRESLTPEEIELIKKDHNETVHSF